MSELLDIREAQEMILAAIKTVEIELCTVENASRRTLAENIFSTVDLPAFANSSMDGFALNSCDLINASAEYPVTLPVVMDIPAGFAGKASLQRGQAARILTGAPVPIGADVVVPVEKTNQFQRPQNGPLPDKVTFFYSANAGDNIRAVGEDLQKGQQVFSKGRVLQPQDIGLLISMGIRQIAVNKKARVALFSSGDELLLPDEDMTAGKIYDSNRCVLKGLIETAGAEVIDLGIARDNPQSVIETLDQVLQNPPDLIVSSAGVSVGAFDYVRQVIEENGSLAFWRVNMRPGKPIAFGQYKGIPFIGLPGNPVSAYIGCKVFVEPCIRKLRGLQPLNWKTVKAVLDEPLRSPDGRESFYRGILRSEGGVTHARLTGHQGSGNLFSLIQANALLIVPAGVKEIPAGGEVSALLLWPE